MSSSSNRLRFLYQGSLASRSGTSSERVRLARRELDTITTLMELIEAPFLRSSLFLDLGCGDRYLESAVLERGMRYVGLDVNTCDFSRDHFPLATGSVDLVVSLAVIEHLRDPSIFISEIFRCLKPGGVVYLSTPNFQYDSRNFYNDPTHVMPYTPVSLEILLTLYNFERIHTFPGLRCKSKWWYLGPWRFFRSFFLLPFGGNVKWAPAFLKGHARSVFALGVKPETCDAHNSFL